MLFSVLIPMYNAEKYISECLESVLHQSFSDYEVIVVDDGSRDGSPTICDDYQNRYPERIRVIHKHNEGVLLTRRRALQEAGGEYILWVDSDDVIKSGLMTTLAVAIAQKAPDLLVFDYELFHDPQKVIHSMQEEDMCLIIGNEKQKVYTQMLTGRDMNELWTKCVKRAMFDLDEDYSPYAHVKMGDDLFLLFPVMTRVQSIVYLKRSFYRYRIVDSSITHSTTYTSYYSYRTIYERAAVYMDLWGIPAEIQGKALDQFVKRVISCIQNAGESAGDFEEFRMFAEAVCLDERKIPIYSNERPKIASKYFQVCYGLLLREEFLALYTLIQVIQKINRFRRR